MICICKECVKSSKIKTMMMCIKNKKVGECFVCGKVGIDIEKENTIVHEFANQIRYYYSAFEYIQGVIESPLAMYFPLINRKNIFEKDNFLLNHAMCYDKAQKVMEWIYANTDLNEFELFDLYKTNKPLYQQFSYASHIKLPLKEADSVLIEQLKEDIKKYNYYEIEEKYQFTDMMRISKSTIVNLKKIDSLKPDFGGKILATMENGEKLYISRQYSPLLKEKLGIGGKRL